MNILTIVILAILAIFALIGYKRGAIKMLFSFFSLILTIAIATAISPKVSESLQKTKLYDSIYETTYKYVNEKVVTTASNTMDSAMNELQLPDSIKNLVKGENHVAQTQADISAAIATKLTQFIFDVLVFAITFLAAMIVVKLIAMAFNIVAMLPVINGTNRILGIGIGFLEGLLVVWVFFVILAIVGNSELALNLYQQINESPILTVIYNHNVIMHMLFK